MNPEYLGELHTRRKILKGIVSSAVILGTSVASTSREPTCYELPSNHENGTYQAPELGFSFNAQRIQKYIDTEQLTYTPGELLEDMLNIDSRLQYVRIAIPMNQPTGMMIAQTEEQLEIVQKMNRKAKPVVGLKQIHYPDYFFPEGTDISTPNLHERVIEEVDAIVPVLERFSDSISAIQLSNEPFSVFPYNPIVPPENETLIKEVYKRVQPLKHDILVTHFVDPRGIDEEAFEKVLRYADIVGLDIYPEGVTCEADYSASIRWYTEAARAVGKRVITAEMQTAPFDYNARYQTFPIKDTFEQTMRQSDSDILLFWNLELPFVLDNTYGDATTLNTIKELIGRSPVIEDSK